MAQDHTQTTPRTNGTEQTEQHAAAQVKTAGQAWVKAAADSAVANRAWTISRIDTALGSIA